MALGSFRQIFLNKGVTEKPVAPAPKIENKTVEKAESKPVKRNTRKKKV